MHERDSRTGFFSIASAGILLVGCRNDQSATGKPATSVEDVSATEDPMREHGVIRRVLVVYRQAAGLLRTAPASVSPNTLRTAASLMRSIELASFTASAPPG
jgi:hypothetical protein